MKEFEVIDSYFDGWTGIAILIASALFFAWAGSFGYAISAICALVAGMMINKQQEKMK